MKKISISVEYEYDALTSLCDQIEFTIRRYAPPRIVVSEISITNGNETRNTKVTISGVEK